ncbi:MAG: hypothetical protein QOE22_521 [Candidatus Parcubacteria bacterium]|jgi:hypothetical protein|nr:hypothetical protein [Candidatus Parcubacteria bacterium]
MFINTWADVLTQSFYGLFYGTVAFLPNLIVALVVFIIGWLIGAGLGRLVAQVVTAARVDDALRSAGVETFVERAGLRMNAGVFLGTLVKWFFIVVFLVAALDVLHLTEVTIFLRTVVLAYLPNVIVAVLILLVAAVLADVVQRVVAGSAAAANLRSANLLGSLARWAIWIFAILAALNQLQIANDFIQPLFTGLVVALALAFGLSFGLGGQQAASRVIERMHEQTR